MYKAIPSGIPVSGQGRSLPCMRAGGYLATEKPYVNCLSARKHSPDTAEIWPRFQASQADCTRAIYGVFQLFVCARAAGGAELLRMRNSAVSQILRPTKTDAGGGPETGMQVGMA